MLPTSSHSPVVPRPQNTVSHGIDSRIKMYAHGRIYGNGCVSDGLSSRKDLAEFHKVYAELHPNVTERAFFNGLRRCVESGIVLEFTLTLEKSIKLFGLVFASEHVLPQRSFYSINELVLCQPYNRMSFEERVLRETLNFFRGRAKNQPTLTEIVFNCPASRVALVSSLKDAGFVHDHERRIYHLDLLHS